MWEQSTCKDSEIMCCPTSCSQMKTDFDIDADESNDHEYNLISIFIISSHYSNFQVSKWPLQIYRLIKVVHDC